MDERVIELLSAPRSGPEALLRGELGDFADEQMLHLLFAELALRSLSAGERNRALRVLRLSFWTGLHEASELFLSVCERERYERAVLRAEDDASHLLSPAAMAQAWDLGAQAGERVLAGRVARDLGESAATAATP